MRILSFTHRFDNSTCSKFSTKSLSSELKLCGILYSPSQILPYITIMSRLKGAKGDEPLTIS